MTHLPEENSRYKDVDYWDERYKTEHCYDWLGGFSKFQHLVKKHIRKEDFILMLGCGNSSLSGDMYSAGYHSITNIDYSSICISAMSSRYKDCSEMTWQQMDMRQLSFPDASFDVVLEKATLDALMVEEKSPWSMSQQTATFIHQTLTEIYEWTPGSSSRMSCTLSGPQESPTADRHTGPVRLSTHSPPLPRSLIGKLLSLAHVAIRLIKLTGQPLPKAWGTFYLNHFCQPLL